MNLKYQKTIYFIVLIALIASLIVSFIYLYKNKTPGNTQHKIQITTSIFPYYSFASEICDFDGNVVMLLKPGAESHTYEPTTEDIITIKNSDIFIYTGGESDKWVETILSSIDTNKTKIIKVMDYITPLTYEHHGKISNDEHVWTSLKNSKTIIFEICDVICEIDPQNKDIYKGNAQRLTEEINNLDIKFKETIELSDKTLIFADRFPFSYFANDYDLNYISAFPSCSEESEPSAQTMAKIIDTVKTENTSAIFYIEFSNQKIADTIQTETGAKKLLFHSCHNITQDEFSSGKTYISLMQQNLENLREAIK